MERYLSHSLSTIDEAGRIGVLGRHVTVQDWLHLIRAEYLEMPGLSLTEAQVERMWNLAPDLAETLLQELQQARFLRLTKKGTYVRADACGH